ncbi:MAG TPA: allantoicase [Longimicrobiales bacterium]|nr:allantoicase [Longimicrobiales bacterium]
MNEFTELVDLASERLGGGVIATNDEFFAPKENLVKDGPAVWIEGKYTERGKWMDGWETRRRRTPGYDWCIVRLGLPGVIAGVVVDTAFFRGNFPESCSIEACALEGVPDAAALEKANWQEILSKSTLQGDSKNPFAIASKERFTHLRLNIFPDGGVARLRVYGTPTPNWERLIARGQLDLAAVEHGARVIAASDMFFGHRHNLIMPGRGVNMGDGWETKRRRGPGNDWVVVRLGRAGSIERVTVDTIHFKGNAPGSFVFEAVRADDANDTVPANGWTEVIPQTQLQPDTSHEFEVNTSGEFTHVRLSIFPDGGVSRLRVFGRVKA